MRRAQRRDAARQERFFFRRSIYPDLVPHGHSFHTPTHTPQGSGSSSPTSTHAPLTHLNAHGAGPDNHALPVHSAPAEVVGADQVEYERSSGAQTPEPVKEDVSNLTPQAGTGTGTSAHSGRDPPTTAAQSRCPSPSLPTFGAVEDEYEEMTVAEIIAGKGESFPGLLGVVNAYLNTLNVEFAAKKRMRSYLNLIKWRADGTLQTAATWMRNFIRSHPAYKHDSVVSDEINFDLMNALDKIERGTRNAPELLPDYYVGSKTDDGCL